MIAVMAREASRENLRIRLPATLKDSWDEMLERKKITQQDGIESLVRLVLEQEDIVQTMMLGQATPTRELMALIMRRLAKSKGVASDVRLSNVIRRGEE